MKLAIRPLLRCHIGNRQTLTSRPTQWPPTNPIAVQQHYTGKLRLTDVKEMFVLMKDQV